MYSCKRSIHFIVKLCAEATVMGKNDKISIWLKKKDNYLSTLKSITYVRQEVYMYICVYVGPLDCSNGRQTNPR